METVRKRHGLVSLGIALMMMLALVVQARPAYAASITLDSTVIETGGTLVARASGFRSDERVESWVSSSRGTVYATNGDSANGNGNITLAIGVRRFWEPGYWAVTLYGRDSGTRVVANFEVKAGPPSGVLDSDAKVIRPGGRVSFHGYGFRNNELVSAWVTAPDGSAEKIKGSPLVARGAEVYFFYDTLPGALDGTWSVTAYGNDSERLLVATFDIKR